MVGERVGAYLITEALGSGRTGLLFLAVHIETGHRAVIQRLPNEDVTAAFAADAALALGLPNSPDVEERVTRDGRPVLFAAIDGGAPGSGATEHTNTQRLPSSHAASPSRGGWRLVVLAACCLILGAAVGGGLWALNASAESEASVVTTKSLPISPVLVVSPVELDAGAGESKPASPARSPEQRIERVPAKLGSAVVVGRGGGQCSPTPEWKRHVQADLQELGQLPQVLNDAALYASVEKELERLSLATDRATSPASCAAAQAGLDVLKRRLGFAAARPVPACTFDERFLEYSRRTLSELRELRAPEQEAEWAREADRLSDALVARNCQRAEQQLDRLRRLVGVTND